MKKLSEIPFYKMQGTGNDFVVIDNRDGHFQKNELIELCPSLCHRRYGIGADGLLVLQQPRVPETDYEMLYRNADGSDAGMCGNGSRCLALLASKLGLGKELTFNVHDNLYKARIAGQNFVSVQFPIESRVKEIRMEGESDLIFQVHTGTEHVVKTVDPADLDDKKKLAKVGKRLRYHIKFKPEGTNVNFFCGLQPDQISQQTYERGVENLTLACGTGAIASALVWHHIQQSETVINKVHVKTPGGELIVSFSFDPEGDFYRQIQLSGAAEIVFKGTYYA